ncbi:hypothetical protein [Streptomyces sp. NPDC090026]|uniref:hypothetical protein n=1 Tax=Streptomyces sp. NPDC090026 TaxID=3365923 RepID=UPI00380CC556
MMSTGGGHKPAHWTAQQCAAYRDVTRAQWLLMVEQGIEPQAANVDSPMRLWDAVKVRNWVRPGEWLAPQCGEYLGISTNAWLALVRSGSAPNSVRKVNKRPVWLAEDVHSVKAAAKPAVEENLEWTAKQCADHLGISAYAWRGMVRDGTAPQPVGFRVWDSEAVRNLAHTDNDLG